MPSEKNNTTSICYDAFISYRHTEPDMFVAKQLHREMESFRLPRNVIKKIGENKKTRINRVFRDRDELPLASNLAEPIRYALEASDFLIVICSPRLNESEWCKKEIDTFLKLKDREHILAVLIEGEPDDSFPEQLRFSEVEEKQPDGSVQTVKVPIEPLAADVRGKSQHEIKKKIKEEIVRLAAPMFGCAYDDLKQRHRERKIKRILTIAGIGSAICLLFGAISTAMALRIQNQNQEISRQSEEITIQKNEIEQQYQEAMISNAKLTAEDALTTLEHGDRVEAVRKVRSVLPDSQVDSDIPYVAEAEYALVEGLQPYANGRTLLPRLSFNHDSLISFMKVSPDREKLITVDGSLLLSVWDIETGKKLLQLEDYVQESVLDWKVDFLDDNRIACITSNSQGTGSLIDIYEITTGQKTTYEMEGGTSLVSDGQGGLAILSMHKVVFWKDGVSKAEWIFENGYSYMSITGAFNEDKTRFAFSQEGKDEMSGKQVVVLDTSTGEVTNCYDMEYEMFGKMRFQGNVLYVINNESIYNTENNIGEAVYYGTSTTGKVVACNLNSYDEILWEYVSEDETLRDVVPSGISGNNILLTNGDSQIQAINALDGTLIASYEFGETIVETSTVKDSQYFYVYTQNGGLYSAHLLDGKLVAAGNGSDLGSYRNGIRDLQFGSGCILIIPYIGTNVIQLAFLQGKQTEIFAENEGAVYLPRISSKNDKILFGNYSDDTYKVVDANDGKELYTIVPNVDYITGVGFTGEQDDTIAILSGGKVALFSAQDGSLTKQYELEGNYKSVILTGTYGENLLAMADSNIQIYETLTGSLLYDVTTEPPFAYGDLAALDAEAKWVAASQKANKTLSIYDVKAGQKTGETAIRASFVSNMFFCNQSEKTTLLVIYRDNSAEAYQIDENGMLVLEKTYEALASSIDQISIGPDGYYALIGSADGFYMRNGEVIARISELKLVNWEKREFITGGGSELYKTPIYDYEMLLNEADEYLKER